MTSMTRQYSAAASQARSAVDKTADFWTQGARTLTGWLPGLPQIDLIPAVERYFDFVQRTVDINRHLTVQWAEAAGALSGMLREQAESASNLVREQAESASDIVREKSESAEQTARSEPTGKTRGLRTSPPHEHPLGGNARYPRYGGGDLIGVPLGHAPIEYFAVAHQVVHRTARFFQRCCTIVAMALIQVHVVGLQALQRGVDLLVDLLRRQPAVDGRHFEVHLRGEHVIGALVPGQHLSEQRLRRAAAVDVGGVDEVDPRVERRLHACLGLFALDPARIGQPRAEADLGHLDVAGAELAEVHAPETTL